jgi:hypothetical protein
MGCHPNFDLVYGVRLTELTSYNENTEIYTLQFKGKTVEIEDLYEAEELFDELLSDINNPHSYSIGIGIYRPHGDYHSGEPEEYIFGVKLWGMSGSCDTVDEVNRGEKRKDEVTDLINSINPDLTLREFGILYMF